MIHHMAKGCIYKWIALHIRVADDFTALETYECVCVCVCGGGGGLVGGGGVVGGGGGGL